MLEQVIIAGFGGQGVLLIGQLLCYAGMAEDKNVSWLPSYGPEMRGGTANCSVIISSDAVASPLVAVADTVIAMNLPSLDKFESSVKPGGRLFINSSIIERKAVRDDIKVHYVPCNEIANALGNGRVANMVMLGAYIAKTLAVAPDNVMTSLAKSFGEKKKHLLPINEKAMAEGAAALA